MLNIAHCHLVTTRPFEISKVPIPRGVAVACVEVLFALKTLLNVFKTPGSQNLTFNPAEAE